jgi:hypothetical protein
MPERVSPIGAPPNFPASSPPPAGRTGVQSSGPQPVSQALVVYRGTAELPLPKWMNHDAFQRLPPGPKRYLWDWQTRQDQLAKRAPLYNTLRSSLEELPSRAWFVRSTDASPHERREAFEPRAKDGIWSSWIWNDSPRKVAKIAAQRRTDTASLTILRDFVDRILGPVSDHKMAKTKLRRVLPRVHPNNLQRLLRPGDKISQPGLEEACARSEALFQGLSLLPTADQRASGRYINRREQWIDAKRFEMSLSGIDMYLERNLRNIYALYEAVQVILNEPIYQELLFRVPQATEDARLSLENVRLLACFLWILFIERLRAAFADVLSARRDAGVYAVSGSNSE